MKLIYAQGACSLSVHILLEELKINYQAVKVSLEDKSVLESYNPKSYVPALILDDGTVMTEAISILQYVSQEHGNAFMPEGSMSRAKCVEWLTYISTELHKGCMPLFHRDSLPKEFVKEAEDKIYKRLEFMEEQLRDQAFIMNNSYTVADMYALAILRILEHVKVKFDNFSEIANYKKNLETSPTISRVIASEKEAKESTELNDSTDDLKFYYRYESFSEVRQ